MRAIQTLSQDKRVLRVPILSWSVSLTPSETYRDVLAYLQSQPFSSGALVVDMYLTSCALSNFPDEYKPSDDYIDAVKREAAEKWRDFAVSVTKFCLECR